MAVLPLAKLGGLLRMSPMNEEPCYRYAACAVTIKMYLRSSAACQANGITDQGFGHQPPYIPRHCARLCTAVASDTDANTDPLPRARTKGHQGALT
jgi:hypothetical protein